MRRAAFFIAMTILGLITIFGICYLIQVWLILDWDPTNWTKRERGQVLAMPVIGFIVAIVISIFTVDSGSNDPMDTPYGY